MPFGIRPVRCVFSRQALSPSRHRQEPGRPYRGLLQPHLEDLRGRNPRMKRLGEPQIPLAFQSPWRWPASRQGRHEEAWTVRAPDVWGPRFPRRKDQAACLHVLPNPPGTCSLPGWPPARDERVTGAVRQGSERAQSARGLALQPRECSLGRPEALAQLASVEKPGPGGPGHLVEQRGRAR